MLAFSSRLRVITECRIERKIKDRRVYPEHKVSVSHLSQAPKLSYELAPIVHPYILASLPQERL
jgi:hypothetical protein